MSVSIVIYLCLTLNALVTGKDTRVMGGRDSHIWDHPYLASMKRISDSKHLCGGVIITERDVVTTAECVHENVVNSNDLIIRVGLQRLALGEDYLDGINYSIKDIYLHPEYVSLIQPGILYHSNIAVVKIQNFFQLSHNVNIVELPTVPHSVGKIGVLSGWGQKLYPNDPYPKKIRKAWMKVLEDSVCSAKLYMRVLLDQFCAFQTIGVGACIGDSGSPLIIDGILVGIVSMFEACAVGVPDVYTDIYSHIEFINSIKNLE